MIDNDEKFEDLYVLDAATLNSMSTTYVNNVSTHVWHNWLGHFSFKRLDYLKDHLHCDTVKYTIDDPCYICHLAKQKRLSFDSNSHMAQSPFNLIHCDIWGSYHVSSQCGHKFFLTLVDDCTRFTWLLIILAIYQFK